MARVEKEGVIHGGAGKAASTGEGTGGGGKGGIVKVAKADANRAGDGRASREVGACKGYAEGVFEDGGAHGKDVIKELHKCGVCLKGDAPGVWVLGINHGGHDVFGLHGAFGEGTGGKVDELGLAWCGDTGGRSAARSKLSGAVGGSSA